MAMTRKEYLARNTALKNIRKASWEGHWKELQDNLLPRRGRFYLTDTNKGEKRNQKVYDNTATLALRTLASGMMAGRTSRLTTPDPTQA